MNFRLGAKSDLPPLPAPVFQPVAHWTQHYTTHLDNGRQRGVRPASILVCQYKGAESWARLARMKRKTGVAASEPVRIALVWQPTRLSGWDAIRGIADYAERFGPWRMLFSQIKDFDPEAPGGFSEFAGFLIFRDFEIGWQNVRWPADIPIVSVEHPRSVITPYQVMPDYYATGRLVAEEFLNREYRRLAYCPRTDLNSGLPRDAWDREQCAGFSDAVRKADAQLLEYPRVPAEWLRSEHERPSPELAEWYKTLHRPAAIMAATDVRARHVLLTAEATGMRVPEDIAVVGVDNEPWTAIAFPGLSSVELDDYRAGYLGAQMLDQLMSGKRVDEKIIRVPPRRLVTRRSSDALAIDDPDVVNAVRFIGENASQPIEVRHVVEAVLISRRALERRFQQALNRTIQEEIRMARIGRAKMLLADEAIPLEQVAQMAGFVSAGALVAMFRRMTGTTPTAYRAAVNGAK